MPCSASVEGTVTSTSNFWSPVPRALQPIDTPDDKNTIKRPRRYSDDVPSDLSPPSSPTATRPRRTTTDGLSRTGQACVNCKTRKIKCDDSPGGCKNCRKFGRECIHEDRNTHDIFKRGHNRRLEAQLTNSQSEIRRLRELVERHGISPDPIEHLPPRSQGFEDSSPPFVPTAAGNGVSAARDGEESSSKSLQEPGPSFPGLSPPTKPIQGQKHMGFVTHIGALQDISDSTGYQIGVFRLRIDVLKFVSPDKGLYNEEMTWMYFVRQLNSSSYRRGTPLGAHARLPDSKAEFQRYAARYMALINAWLPVIPRQYLDRLIEWIYGHRDPNTAQMDPADICRVQMLLALVKYSEWSSNSGRALSARLYGEGMRKEAFRHYTSAIRHFHRLAICYSLDTVQVAVLISAFMRQFPHPGALWMMNSWSMAIAVDMSLHRSALVLDPDDQETTSRCATELRKRIFWSIFSLRVMRCGSLARPTGMRWEDFDIEVPDVVPDTPEDSQDRMPSDQHCSFRAGIEFMRLCELFNKAYNDIYAIRSSVRYRDSVAEIEEQQAMWRRSLPISLQARESVCRQHGPPKHEFTALTEQLNFLEAKLTLIIRHPDVCQNESHGWKVTNARLCGIACMQILESGDRLRGMGALEMTWCTMTTCIAAVLTLLWAHSASGKSLEDEQLEPLYNSLLQGLDLLCVAGHALGSEDQLAKTIADVITKWHSVAGVPVKAWKTAKQGAAVYSDAAAADQSDAPCAIIGSSGGTAFEHSQLPGPNEWHCSAQRLAGLNKDATLRWKSDGNTRTGVLSREAMQRYMHELLNAPPEESLQSWDEFASLLEDTQLHEQGLSFTSGATLDIGSPTIKDRGCKRATRAGERQCEELAGTLRLAALHH